jgi:hypothetical protein
MISKKILYSEQLLQLVLALSLLQVDPTNYLEWGVSRIHSDDGSPWQLEIAPTIFSDYPYMNRKTYLPFNEDMGRFNHIHSYGLQTYLLNLSDEPIPAATALHSNEITSRFIDNTTRPIVAADNASSVTTVTTTTTSTSSLSPASLINLIQESGSTGNSIEDPFLHADFLSAHNAEESIAEQNLADLHDYEEGVEPSSLFVPTKNEISAEQDVWLEFRGLQQQQQQQNSSQGHANRINVIELSLNDTTYTRSAVIDWSDYLPFVNDTEAEKIQTKETDEQRQQHTAEDSARAKQHTDDVGDQDKNEPVITSSVELTVEVSRKREEKQQAKKEKERMKKAKM